MSSFQPPPTGASRPKPSADSIFYEFSPEESKVMKECNRESFFQRSLPLTVIFGAGSYAAVSAGYFKASPKWGPWPKVIVGGILGYLVGKYSYQNKCAEKLMQIPNSEIGRILRERRGKLKNDSFEGNIMTPAITYGTTGADMPSFSTDYKSDINFDNNKPVNSLDIDYRPDYDGLSINKTNEIPLSSFNTSSSYEELRARNRQEYERTQPNKPVYRTPTPQSNSQLNEINLSWDGQTYPPPDQLRNQQPKESRNKYGDVY